MTLLYHLPHDAAMDAYRSDLTGERLGWAIKQHPSSFSPTHRVQLHPEDGPVILVYDEVWEVDPDVDEVFPSEDAAREAFWAERTRT